MTPTATTATARPPRPLRISPRLRRILRMTIAIPIGFALVFTMFLCSCQRRMIYFPQRYDPAIYRMELPPGSEELAYLVEGCGRQVAFYIPPNNPHAAASSAAAPAPPPARLWVFFNGNAARSLDWLDMIDHVSRADTGILLVDYPGYGLCEGSPTRERIRKSARGAFEALASHFGISARQLENASEINVLGFSIGTATGLDFAVEHPVRRVILLAPFTSLLDMARLSVGWPLCHLLLDRFDNRARLDELAHRSPPPDVHIFHGDSDEVVPQRMGRALAESHPEMIDFQSIPGADHNALPDLARPQLLSLLNGDAKGQKGPKDQ